MPTIEQIREKIKRNFPSGAAQSSHKGPLVWNRETATTIVTSCGTYRINRMYVKDEDTQGYFVQLAPTPTAGAKHLAGPFLIPRDAREAAQMHADGLPLQADLA
jgi:hypothetical protein